MASGRPTARAQRRWSRPSSLWLLGMDGSGSDQDGHRDHDQAVDVAAEPGRAAPLGLCREVRAPVSRFSTIQVLRNTYSVPSRLIQSTAAGLLEALRRLNDARALGVSSRIPPR
jgi:hypothetical protein